MKKLVILLVLLATVVVAQQSNPPHMQYPYNLYVNDPNEAYVTYDENPSMIIKSTAARPYRNPNLVYATATDCGVECVSSYDYCIRTGQPTVTCAGLSRECNNLCKLALTGSDCDRACAVSYAQCTKSMSQHGCFEFFGTCREQCKPQVQSPSPVMPCIDNCQKSYEACLKAGGSVNTCSSGVYDACASGCPETSRPAMITPRVVQPKPVVQVPAVVQSCPMSCGAKCGLRYDDCIAANGRNCFAQSSACLKECSPVEYSVWAEFKSWLRQ